MITTQEVVRSVRKHNGYRKAAAEELGISPETVRNHIKIALRKGQNIPKPPPSKGNTGNTGRREDTSLYTTPRVKVDRDEVLECEEKYTNQMAFQMAGRNWAKCQQILDQAKYEIEKPMEVECILDLPLRDVCESSRATECLESAGIEWVKDLPLHTSKNLLRINGFGTTALDITWHSILKEAVKREALLFQKLCNK